jgi:hypothetical protein
MARSMQWLRGDRDSPYPQEAMTSTSNVFTSKTNPKLAFAAVGAVACGFALGTTFGNEASQARALDLANAQVAALLQKLSHSRGFAPNTPIATAIDIAKLRAQVRAIRIQESENLGPEILRHLVV